MTVIGKIIGSLFVAALPAVMSHPASAQVTFNWVTVGSPGNAADPLNSGTIPGIGSVAYEFRIAKHEVTNAQYAEFLNAVAATDTNGLYKANMGGDIFRGGITQSGSSGSFTYSVKANMGNKPVNYVSFFDAMRFVNWLHNGQPTGAQGAGTTEVGVYTISDGVSETRAAGARFFIPTENEWYKAAYHQPVANGGDSDNYWLYPTASNSVPTVATANSTGDISNPGANVANYINGADWNGQNGNVTTIGSAGALSESFYGTSDQGGNVFEWNETLRSSIYRVARGGAWIVAGIDLRSSFGLLAQPIVEALDIGFRVASPPPAEVCGNGMVEGGEQCDDGGVVDGDGCSSTCTVESGYTCDAGEPSVCTDINECTLGTDNCDANASCTNTPGSFTCTCNTGYSGNGVSCADDDECTLGTDNCDLNAICTNLPGSFICACNTGYSGRADFVDSGQTLGDGYTYQALVDDIDNDGDADIVSLEEGFNRVQIYFNDGSGLFLFSSSKSFQRTTGHNSGRLADLDADGNLDLIIGGLGSAVGITVYSGDGTGGFTEVWSNTWSFSRIRSVEVGDIDGNQSDDFVATGSISGAANVQVCLNTGTNTYLCTSAASGIGSAHDAALVDLDGDLDLDLAVAAESPSPFDPGEVKILLNSGGVFTDTGQSITAPFPYGLDAGDVDGDGDTDLAVGNQASTPNQILFNGGTGTFTDSGQALGAEATNAVVLGDIDLDGDLDLVAINEGHGGRGFVVYGNDGFGSFAEQEFGSSNFKHSGVLVDVDGDGDLDLVTGDYATGPSNNHAPDQVIINNLNCIDDDECALGTDNCTVHGICTNTPGSFTCTCNVGYAGTICDQCAPDYYNYPTCVFCEATTTCSGRGTCNALGECDCASGFTGAACDACLGGYFGPSCLECPGGAAVPCSGNGVCDDGIAGSGQCACGAGWTGAACLQPVAVLSEPDGVGKTRFVSFEIPASLAGHSTALRANLVSLHHVAPPYTGGASVPFTSFEGEVRWVGPPTQYVESSSSATPFYAAVLQCTPHYQDWSTVGLLHVTGSAIVPSSIYEVENVAASCMGIEDTCTAVSAPLTVNTTRWGDVEIPYNPPSTTAQPDVGDISALVNKFRSAPGAPIKARALLAGDDAFGNITTLGIDLGFGHIAACVDAFRGRPYPHTIQSCP